MNRGRRGLLLAGTMCCVGGTAFAETVPTSGQGGATPNTDVGNSGGTLSDKLDATNGVIHPQGAVDPGMQKPAPATGTMKVIPPPGSPGGAPGVQPK